VALTSRTNLPAPARWGSFGLWGALGIWLTTRADIHGAALLAGFAIGGVSLLVHRAEAQ
jgi:hypothetical protein